MTNGTAVFNTGTTQFLALDLSATVLSWHDNVYGNWLGNIYQIDQTNGTISLLYNNTNSYKYVQDMGVPANDWMDRLWAVNNQSLIYFTNGSWTPIIVNTNKDSLGNFTTASIPVFGPDGAAYFSIQTGGDGYGSIHRIGTNGIDTEMVRVNDLSDTIDWPGRLMFASDGCFYDVTIMTASSGPNPHFLNTPLITRYWNYQPTAITGGDFNQTNGTRTIKWPSTRSQQYQIQTRTNLILGNWGNLSPTNITATSGLTSYTYQTTNIWRPSLFYRLVASNGIPASFAGIFRSNQYCNVQGLPAMFTVEAPIVQGTNSGPFTNPPPPPPGP
jgi:hypothetical protein